MSYILSDILSDTLSDMLSDILSDTLSNMRDGWPVGYPWTDAWLPGGRRTARTADGRTADGRAAAARHPSMDSQLAIHPSYWIGYRIGYRIAYRIGYRIGYWIGYGTSNRVFELPNKGQWDMRENHPVYHVAQSCPVQTPTYMNHPEMT